MSDLLWLLLPQQITGVVLFILTPEEGQKYLRQREKLSESFGAVCVNFILFFSVIWFSLFIFF